MELGRLFRGRREELGLSQSEVARRAGLTSSVISRLEEGENIGRADNVARVASVLGIPGNEVQAALLEGEAERILADARQRISYLRAGQPQVADASGRRLTATLVAAGSY